MKQGEKLLVLSLICYDEIGYKSFSFKLNKASEPVSAPVAI